MMHRLVVKILIIALFFTTLHFNFDTNPTTVAAKSSQYESGNLTLEDSISENEPIQIDWGGFSEEKIQTIKTQFSKNMKYIAVFYYPRLSNLLTINESLELLSLSTKDIMQLIKELTTEEYSLIKQIAPAAISDYEITKDPKSYINQVEGLLQEKKSEQPEAEENSLSSAAQSTSTNPSDFRFKEKNADYTYKSTTDGVIDPVLKTSTQSDVDIYLQGRNGLDVSIVRSYSSLNSKIITPSLMEGTDLVNCNLASETDDCMGNVAESNTNNQDINFIATGWGLNIPTLSFDSVKGLSTTVSATKSWYNRTGGEGIPAKTFSLDDGSSYQFRGTDSKPYGYPYSNVKYTQKDSKYYLEIDEFITYEFDTEGKILSKKNRYGDTITYSVSNSAVTITDTVGRVITVTRDYGNSNRITGIKVTNNDAQKTLLYNIAYNSTSKSANITIRNYNIGTNEMGVE